MPLKPILSLHASVLDLPNRDDRVVECARLDPAGRRVPQTAVGVEVNRKVELQPPHRCRLLKSPASHRSHTAVASLTLVSHCRRQAHTGVALQAIAAEVGSGRSAANCLQRWSRRGAGTVLKKGRWDKEEDQALLQVQLSSYFHIHKNGIVICKYRQCFRRRYKYQYHAQEGALGQG